VQSRKLGVQHLTAGGPRLRRASEDRHRKKRACRDHNDHYAIHHLTAGGPRLRRASEDRRRKKRACRDRPLTAPSKIEEKSGKSI
jgi:hypothetical protein